MPQLIEREVLLLLLSVQLDKVVCPIDSVGMSMTASSISHFMGLFTFTFVETAAVCVGRWLENTLVSIVYVCFFVFSSINIMYRCVYIDASALIFTDLS